MSYKGYSFNLHEENDKDIIDWLNDKKVTQTIKIALRNQMKTENENIPDDNSMELLSVIKKAIESSNNNEQSATIEKDIASKQSNEKQSLSGEDVEDFEKIFEM